MDGWRELVSGQASSGLSVAAYCEREAVATSSFWRWRRLLQGSMLSTSAGNLTSGRTRPSVPDFVDLGTLSEHGAPVALRIDLGHGVVLQLTLG
jgi:hypothetical protein